MSPTTEKLSPVDAAWARMDQAGNPADIVVLMRFDEIVGLDVLEELIATHLLSQARFRQRLIEAGGGLWRPRWSPVPSRVENHLSRRRVKGEGTEHALAELLSEYISEPFPAELPPWRLCLVEGLSEGSAIVAHLHHCLGDGFALIQVLLTLTEELSAEGENDQRSAGNGSSAGRAKRAVLPLPRSKSRTAVAALMDLARVLALPFDRSTALRGELSGQRLVAWSRAIPLHAVRAAARARGSTVNDLLLAVFTSALRRYLEVHGQPEPLRAVVPVDLRRMLARPNEEQGNYFGLVFLDLPLDERSEEIRWRAIKTQMDHLKGGQQALVTLLLLSLVGQAPLFLARWALWIFARKASFVVSNVPGPPRPLALGGRRIRDLMFWVPHPQGLACGASILSYAGSIRVGIRTDAAVVPRPEELATAFADELDAWLAESLWSAPEKRTTGSDAAPVQAGAS